MKIKRQISATIVVLFSFMCVFTNPAYGVETCPAVSQVIVTDNASECAGENIGGYTVVEYKNIADVISNLNQSGFIDGFQLNQYTPTRTGNYSRDGHAVLGCGPTAMGTVENYHLQPDSYNLEHRKVDDNFTRVLADQGKVSEWFPQIQPGTPNVNYFDNEGTGCKFYIVDDVLGVFGYEVDIMNLWQQYDTWESRANGLYNIAKSEIDNGRPLILGLNASMQTGNPNHYVVITGYKKARNNSNDEKIFLYVLKGWGTNRIYDSNGNFVRYEYDHGYRNEWWQVNVTTIKQWNFWLFTVDDVVEKHNMKNILVYKIKPVKRDSDTMFVDLSSNHWAYRYLDFLYKHQVISGYPLNGDRYFLPDASILRKDALFLIMKGAGINVPAKGTAEYDQAIARAEEFEDLKNSRDELAKVYIGTALRWNLITPYAWYNKNFRPQASITRGEFAQLLVAASLLTHHSLGCLRENEMSGADNNSYKGCLITLYNAKIIDGYDTGSNPDLRVDGNITRAEVSKVVYNAFYRMIYECQLRPGGN